MKASVGRNNVRYFGEAKCLTAVGLYRLILPTIMSNVNSDKRPKGLLPAIEIHGTDL